MKIWNLVNEWFKNHPHIVQFSSTFLGVLLAAIVACWVNESETRDSSNNLMQVMYRDCLNVRNSTASLKNDIRASIGLNGSLDNAFDELAKSFNLDLESEDVVIKTIEEASKTRELTQFDESVFRGAQLPSLMFEALANNIRLYGRMHPLTYAKVLEYLPIISGSSGGYNESTGRAAILQTQYRVSTAGRKEFFNSLPNLQRKQANFAFNKADNAHRRTIADLLVNAVIALDELDDSLFRACHHLEWEWKLRECGIAESKFLSVFEAEEITLAENLVCD